MNTKLTVKKTADTNYIPIMYQVIDVAPAGTLGDTNCIIMIERVGWDTKDNYEAWQKTRDVTGMQGTLGAFEAATLDTLEVYYARTPSTDM